MLRRILCFILIVGVCTTTVCAEDVQPDIATEAFGLLSEASNDIEAAPKIVEGKELQTGYAVPASADDSVPAVPYTADVSEWFEHEEGESISYAASASILFAKVNLDKDTGKLSYTPSDRCGNMEVHIYVIASNEHGKSERVDIAVSVGKVPNAEKPTLGRIQETYYKTSDISGENMHISVQSNGNILHGIYYNGQALNLWRDYSQDVNGTDNITNITVLKSFCKNLDIGIHTLIFKFNGADLQFTLNVKKTAEPCLVTFRSVGVADTFGQLDCEYEGTVPLPVLAGNEYYDFGGWWSLPDGDEPSEQYSADTPVTRSVVRLTAKWIKRKDCPETDEKNTNLSSLSIKRSGPALYPSFRSDIHDYYADITVSDNDSVIAFTVFPFEKENIFSMVECVVSGDDETRILESELNGLVGLNSVMCTLNDKKYNLLTIQITSADRSVTDEYRVHLRYNSEPLKHNVSFTGGGTEILKSEMIQHGDTAALPDTPQKSGYRFCGWFTEENGKGDEFTEKTLILSDITAYAYWARKSSGRTSSGAKLQKVLTASEDEDFSEVTQKNDTRKCKPYICGYSNGTFRPENLMTRAEAATIFMRISDDYDNSFNYSCNFSDMTDDDWYCNAVCYIDSKAGLSKTSKKYYPEVEITRGEFCVLLTQLLDISLTETDVVFSDIDSAEEQQAAGILYQMGVINGYGDNTFRPDSPITRAEAVSIINKICKVNTESKNNNIFSDVLPEHWAYNDIILATIQ